MTTSYHTNSDEQVEHYVMDFLRRLFPHPHLVIRREHYGVLGGIRVDRFDGNGPILQTAIDDLIGRLSKYIALNVEIFAEEEYTMLVGLPPEIISRMRNDYKVCARLCLVWHDPYVRAESHGLAVDENLRSRPWRDV